MFSCEAGQPVNELAEACLRSPLGWEKEKTATAGLGPLFGYHKGTGQVEGKLGMTLLLAIEASQSNGTVYRVLLGFDIHPLASWLSAIARLF
jgi:hypothetical protein